MNALLLRCCGYLRALATHQALGSRSVISVVRGQGRSHVHDPGSRLLKVRLAPVRLKAARTRRRAEAQQRTRPSRSPTWADPASFPTGLRRLRLPAFPWRLRPGCPCGPPGFPGSLRRRLAPLPPDRRFRTGLPRRPKPLRSPSDPAGLPGEVDALSKSLHWRIAHAAAKLRTSFARSAEHLRVPRSHRLRPKPPPRPPGTGSVSPTRYAQDINARVQRMCPSPAPRSRGNSSRSVTFMWRKGTGCGWLWKTWEN
jgi:hypothetical protein